MGERRWVPVDNECVNDGVAMKLCFYWSSPFPHSPRSSSAFFLSCSCGLFSSSS